MRVLGKLKAEPGIWMYEAPTPEIGVNDVLIKIKKTAICGTDLHIYNWDEWAQKNITVPLITGHEYAGEIVAIGELVKGFNVGDRVSGEGHLNCGFCRNCRAGKRHLCRNHTSVGVFRQGCFAEYLSIPASNVFHIPRQVSDDIASILDPMGNATHTALSFDLVGEDVLINGAGPVGIMAAAIARHAGARHVVITDVNDYRLALAERIGATKAVNVNHTSIRDVMKSLEIKEGFDVGLEMSGNPTAFNMMIDTMIHGGHIALLGFLPHNTQVEWSQFVLKGLFLKGIYGREMYETWYKMVSMLQSGLDVSPVITHHFPASEYQTAFEVMNSGQSGKVILNWDA